MNCQFLKEKSFFNEKNLKIGDEVDAGSMKLRSAKDVEMMKLIHEEGSGVTQKDHEEETGNEDDK
ncbi:hypothetical protein [Chryseobacterium mucoviscidosis]|uniref:hypothetical protein n=1 Tax=Chryseobacterium mucoviscidosis TaxID=1945581 RepID=UPI00301A610C